MCWKTNNLKPIKKKAKEDIPVFKIVRVNEDDVIMSYYKQFFYKCGKTYNTEIGKMQKTEYQVDPIHYIEEGFHSYSADCTYNYCGKVIPSDLVGFSCLKEAMVVLLEGKEIFCDTLVSRDGFKVKKLNCIIPKGAEYYLNETGEYVSNQIKILNVE